MLGDVYLADLNPSRGSEQAGIRPVIIVQRDTLD
ncbi:type II toxin-antitoxin system PemK/MazF family toxin, partial [Microcoleus sp. herbarium8]